MATIKRFAHLKNWQKDHKNCQVIHYEDQGYRAHDGTSIKNERIAEQTRLSFPIEKIMSGPALHLNATSYNDPSFKEEGTPYEI